MTDLERSVRGALADRADDVRPATDLASLVIARHRQHRARAAVGTAVAAALVAAGVPIGLHVAPTGGAPVTKPPGQTCPSDQRPTPLDQGARLPDQRTARGSLGNDPALVRKVLEQGWATMKREPERPGAPVRPPLDATTAHVQLVEQVGTLIVGLVYAYDARRSRVEGQWVAGTSADTLAGSGGVPWLDLAAINKNGDDAVLLAINTFHCANYAIVVAPPDSQVTLAGDIVNAAARVVPYSRSVPLRGGIAFVPTPGTGSGLVLTVRRDGQPLAHANMFDRMPASLVWPQVDDLAAAINAGRGQVDSTVAKDAFGPLWYGLRTVVVGRPEVLWGGTSPSGRPLVLVSVVFDSGARYLSDWTRIPGGFGGDYGGLLPAGKLDKQVFAWQSSSAGALVVVATRGVRAEAVRADSSVVPIPWHDGGGMLAKATDVTLVRVYDAGGKLIEERKPGTGLLGAGIGL